MAQVAQIEALINAAQKVIGWDVIFKVERENSRSCPLDNCPIMLVIPLRPMKRFCRRPGRGATFSTESAVFCPSGRSLPVMATKRAGQIRCK
jgi:hypothetical protein